jgi:predicted SnoaL-like aldol condensation-catalyzing enzyme
VTTIADRNKHLIQACYEQFFAEGRLDGLADIVDEDFVQHSPDSPSGRDAYLEHLKNAAFAGGTSDIKRVIATDEYVLVHHHLRLSGDDGPGLAVMDLWRLRGGTIVEHWDVEQPMPEPSRVPNGML